MIILHISYLSVIKYQSYTIQLFDNLPLILYILNKSLLFGIKKGLNSQFPQER
jgi:hypothetical protein